MKYLIALIQLLLVFAPQPAKAKGTSSSGGGNALESEFKSIGFQIIDQLIKADEAEIEGVKLNELNSILKASEIIVSEVALNRDGKPVDALNYPDLQKIELYRISWSTQLDSSQKERLVIHEILGLARKDDRNYQLSAAMLAKLNRTTEIVFTEITFRGSVVADLVKNIDLKGIFPPPAVFVNKDNKAQMSFFVGLLPEFGMSCHFVLDDVDPTVNDIRLSEGWQSHINTDHRDSNCNLQTTHGYIENGWVTLYVDNDAIQPLWDRLAKGASSFDYKLIRGSSPSESSPIILLRISNL